MKALLLTALATALLVFVSSANAATSTVRIANATSTSEFLTATPGGVVQMRVAGAPGQIWTKAGVAPGFVSFAESGRCLTGRGAGPATVEPCSGARNQQWRTDADGFMFNRALGLALEVSLSPLQPRVRLAPFTGLANQRWRQKAA